MRSDVIKMINNRVKIENKNIESQLLVLSSLNMQIIFLKYFCVVLSNYGL
jgi:hypothetical protein